MAKLILLKPVDLIFQLLESTPLLIENIIILMFLHPYKVRIILSLQLATIQTIAEIDAFLYDHEHKVVNLF
jgi:hypothetical protein